MDDANATIDAQRETAMSEIDARVSTDQAAVDATFRDAQQKADAEVAAGEAKADQAKKPAESQSFWDRAIDAWQSVVQAIADTLVSLWTAVIAKVQAVFDAALSLAQTILDGLVKAVSMLISAYYDLVRSVIRNVIGQVFPELAEALCAWADKVQAALIAVCEAIAGALMVALKALADGIIAGMGIALAGYKAYIAFLQSMADSIQRGEWPDAATMLLDALLTAAGIDPAGFRATFGKIDEIIDDVVENPGAIAMNGAEAVGTGFLQFGDNFLEHFVEGSVEWLTGAANVELPDEFSIAGIFDVCCQVLGLTPEYLREKAVEHVGEGGVEAVEEMYAGVLAFLDGGFAGLWEHVQDKLTGLVDDVVIAIGSWLVEKAILVVGRWIAGLAATFGASAILEALIAAWQFAMWIADQMQAMYAIVQSTVDSVYDFVKGNIQPAADKIEGTLANLIAPAIDLVAKLLNISNIADKVQSVIEGVREMIDGAIDSVFEALASALGFGGKEEEDEAEGEDASFSEVPFTLTNEAGEEERHKLWYEMNGDQATMMMASTIAPVVKNPEVPEAAKGKVAAIANEGEADAERVPAAGEDATKAGAAKKEAQSDLEEAAAAMGGVAGADAEPIVEQELGLSMSGEVHTLFAYPDADGTIKFDMASRRSYFIGALGDALKALEPRMRRDRSLEDVYFELMEVRTEVRDFEHDLSNPDNNRTAATKQATIDLMHARLTVLAKRLDAIGRKYGLTSLDDFDVETQFTTDGSSLKPEYRGCKAIRSKFYGAPTYTAAAEAARDAVLEAQEEKARSLDSTAPDGSYVCPCCGQVRDPSSNEGVFTIDHRKAAASHWNDVGNATDQKTRVAWYSDIGNHDYMCKSCNSSKGSDSGDEKAFYTDQVTPAFTGPGGNN